jgi:hypothetical protein
MKIGTFFFKVWRWASILLIIGALVWTYSVLPAMVAIDFSTSGLAEKYISKEHVFYIVMGLFLSNNVLIAGLVKQIPKMDATHLPIFKRDIWAKHREELNEHLTNWLYCLMAVINTVIGFSLFALATINSSSFQMDVFDFSWIYYVGMALLIVVFVLPVRLFWTPVPKDRI